MKKSIQFLFVALGMFVALGFGSAQAKDDNSAACLSSLKEQKLIPQNCSDFYGGCLGKMFESKKAFDEYNKCLSNPPKKKTGFVKAGAAGLFSSSNSSDTLSNEDRKAMVEHASCYGLCKASPSNQRIECESSCNWAFQQKIKNNHLSSKPAKDSKGVD